MPRQSQSKCPRHMQLSKRLIAMTVIHAEGNPSSQSLPQPHFYAMNIHRDKADSLQDPKAFLIGYMIVTPHQGTWQIVTIMMRIPSPDKQVTQSQNRSGSISYFMFLLYQLCIFTLFGKTECYIYQHFAPNMTDTLKRYCILNFQPSKLVCISCQLVNGIVAVLEVVLQRQFKPK